MRQCGILLIALWLTAGCGQANGPESDRTQDPSDQPTAAEAETEGNTAGSDSDSLAELSRDPEALREAMRDPDRRRELMEQLRERRGEVVDDEVRAERRAAIRERMRQQRGDGRDARDPSVVEHFGRRSSLRGSWWQDDDISASLGLAEDQRRALEAADAKRSEAAREHRQALAEATAQLRAQLAEAERESIRRLIDQRAEAAAALAEAERDWMLGVLETLSDEQIKALAREHPQAFAGLAGGRR